MRIFMSTLRGFAIACSLLAEFTFRPSPRGESSSFAPDFANRYRVDPYSCALPETVNAMFTLALFLHLWTGFADRDGL